MKTCRTCLFIDHFQGLKLGTKSALCKFWDRLTVKTSQPACLRHIRNLQDMGVG